MRVWYEVRFQYYDLQVRTYLVLFGTFRTNFPKLRNRLKYFSENQMSAPTIAEEKEYYYSLFIHLN